MLRLSAEDHKMVTDAVAAAEAETDGEIVTIAAARSDAYHDVGLHYALLAMLLVPAIWSALPQSVVNWWLDHFLAWDQALDHRLLLLLLLVKQAAVFLIVRYALAYMPLRMALTPGATKDRRVQRRALELFRASAERRTTARTGVLLYLSAAEHRAEIVADEAIHSKVAPELWGDAMAALITEVKAGRPGAGMAKAVEMIGVVLADHFPGSPGDVNELSDRLIEL